MPAGPHMGHDADPGDAHPRNPSTGADTLLLCRRCSQTIREGPCGCGHVYRAGQNYYDFLQDEDYYWGELSKGEMRQFLQASHTRGWKTAAADLLYTRRPDLRSYLEDPDSNKPLPKDRFPLPGDTDNCRWCRFHELCKKEIEDSLERGRQALKQEDHAEIQAAMEAIQETVQAGAQKMYAQAGMGDAAGSEGFEGGFEDVEPEAEPAGGDEEEVVEADYEIVEEKE